MLLQRKRMMTILSMTMYPVLLLLMMRLSSFPGGNLVKFIDFISEDVSAHPLRISWNRHTLPDYGVVRNLKYDMTRHPFYNRISDGNGVPPYVWGEADLALGGVRVLDPSYVGKLMVLPKASGVLLEVEE